MTTAASPAPAPPAAVATSGDRILIVDDDPGVRSALNRMLGRVGYTLLGVASGEEALNAIQGGPFSCGVVDLRMPGMGGYGFIRRCRTLRPELPIVVLTGHGDKQDVIECLRLGVADFVSKPWSDSELRTAIMRAVETGQRYRGRGPAPASPSGASGARPVGEGQAGPAENAGLAAEAMKAVRDGKVRLPLVPEVAIQARTLAGSDDVSAPRMRDVVEADPALARRILHLANNPYFLGYGKVTELQAAIARIGFREISNLLDTLIAHQLYNVIFTDPERRDAVQRIWRHSWARGIAMRFIVQARPDLGLTPDRAYLAGLFADVGAPFLLKTITGLAPRAPFTEVMSASAEAHAQLGELMAQAWSLPGECVVAARRHHEPGMLEKAHPVLLCTWAAESVCHQLGIAGDPSPVPYQEEAVKLLNLTSAGRALLLGKTNAYLDELGASIEAFPET